MNDPPDQTAELSAANLLSFCGMIFAKCSRTSSSCSRRPGVHVEEDDALALEVVLQLVVDDLGLVLGADAREVLLLGLGDPEPVPRVEDLGRQVLPLVSLLLGRLDVVVDVVEVDAREVGAPARHRAREEVVERLVTERAHPVGLGLVVGDDVDQPVREALGRLVDRGEVVDVPAVAVVGTDVTDDVGLALAHSVSPPDARRNERLVALGLERVRQLGAAGGDDAPVRRRRGRGPA